MLPRNPTELARLESEELFVPESRAEAQLLEPARRAGYELPVIGTSAEPEGEIYWHSPSGHSWLFRNHRSDPTAELYGGVVVPSEQRDKLERLLRTGFAPDIILIGHELPQGHGPGDPIPDLVPRRRAKIERRDLIEIAPCRELAPASAQTALTLGRLALKTTKALTVGALALGTAVGNAIGSLDPVVVAGVRDPASGAVTWVEVTRWAW